MAELRAFGALDFRDDSGTELRALLAQPKRAALLAYLALARPRGFQRRDRLLALFWPELDNDHARDALNQGLRFLRKTLGADVVVSRGAEEVGVGYGRIDCDVVRFEELLGREQYEEALAQYRGELLQSFHADASVEFDQWLETERSALHAQASQAAWALVERAELTNEPGLAVNWAKRAITLAPQDEVALRRLVGLLDRTGDRAGAVRAYEDFSRRLDQELHLGASPETVALIEAVRARTVPQITSSGIEERAAPVAGHLSPPPTPSASPDTLLRPATSPAWVMKRAVGAALVVAASILLIAFRGWWLPTRGEATLTSNESAHRYYLEARRNAELGARTSGNRDRARVWPLAVQLYEKAIEQDPAFARAYAELAFTHLRIHWFLRDRGSDHVKQAWTALTEAMRLAPDDPEVIRVRGFYYYYGERDYPRALHEFEAVLRALPKDAGATFQIGIVQRRLGRLPEALRLFERAMSIDGSNPARYSALCETYLGMRQFTKAEACLKHVIRMAPDRIYTYNFLLATYIAWRGDTTQGRRVMEDATQHVSMHDMASGLAWLALLRRDYPAAISYTDAVDAGIVGQGSGARSLDMQYGQLYHLLGDTAQSREHYETALRAFGKTDVDQAPGTRKVPIAIAYAGLGREADALREAREAEALIRTNPDLWERPILLDELVGAYAAAGDSTKALGLIRELLATDYYNSLTIARLRLEPRFDPLRSVSEFQKLIRE